MSPTASLLQYIEVIDGSYRTFAAAEVKFIIIIGNLNENGKIQSETFIHSEYFNTLLVIVGCGRSISYKEKNLKFKLVYCSLIVSIQIAFFIIFSFDDLWYFISFRIHKAR